MIKGNMNFTTRELMTACSHCMRL